MGDEVEQADDDAGLSADERKVARRIARLLHGMDFAAQGGEGAEQRKASFKVNKSAYSKRGRTVVRRLTKAGVTMDVPADFSDED